MEIIQIFADNIANLADLLYSVLTAVTLFAAYEFNRQYNIFKDKGDDSVHFRIYGKLRYLFLAMGFEYALQIIKSSLPNKFSIPTTIADLIVYLIIGIIMIQIALGNFFNKKQ